jgi:hypothetical protein
MCKKGITESTKLIKGDVPCFTCVKKDATARKKTTEEVKPESSFRKRDRFRRIFK